MASPMVPTVRGEAHVVLRREREYFNIKGKSLETVREPLSLGISKAGVPAPLCWRQRHACGQGRPRQTSVRCRFGPDGRTRIPVPGWLLGPVNVYCFLHLCKQNTKG